jgi:hypothetical protein
MTPNLHPKIRNPSRPKNSSFPWISCRLMPTPRFRKSRYRCTPFLDTKEALESPHNDPRAWRRSTTNASCRVAVRAIKDHRVRTPRAAASILYKIPSNHTPPHARANFGEVVVALWCHRVSRL